MLVIILPYVGRYIKFGGFYEGYGVFPPQYVAGAPGFNPGYYIFLAFVALLGLAFLFIPKLFGFKWSKDDSPAGGENKGGFPPWFRPGAAVMFISWILMWFGYSIWEPLEYIAKFAFLPLWWGFILTLDGFVYKRSGGRSLIKNRPRTVVLLSVFSIGGWILFELLNYFVYANWYYPNVNGHFFSQFGYTVNFFLCYGTVWPVVFEWYNLLHTFKPLRKIYTNGPRINFPRWMQVAVFLLGAAVLVLTAMFPYPLFWGLWVGPPLLLGAALALAGFWNPFTSIKKGDWTRVNLIAMAAFLNGFLWEFWNHGSQAFGKAALGIKTNPNFWQYDVPYVNVIHIFSEMPILGYFGYIIFGLFTWILWLVGAHLLGFNPDFNIDDYGKNDDKY